MRWGVYAEYARATGAALAAVILASLLLMQASRNGSDLWLSFWARARLGGLPTWPRVGTRAYKTLALSAGTLDVSPVTLAAGSSLHMSRDNCSSLHISFSCVGIRCVCRRTPPI